MTKSRTIACLLLLVAAVATTTGTAAVELHGRVVDADSHELLPARVHVQSADGASYMVKSVGGEAVHYDRNPKHLPGSSEAHTTLSAAPFVARLAPGQYTLRVERGKEYLPLVETVTLTDEPVEVTLPLRRWCNMAERGWYSGDTHVHRTLDELPNVMLAEDLNVALPLTHWVTQSHVPPSQGDKSTDNAAGNELIEVSPTHVIYPLNTEYEIFSVGDRRHTLGAIFVLNHRSPLPVGAPPVAPIAKLAREQQALLDLDKHSWPWSLMLVPVMDVDLFELANNHVWQTQFGFKQWTTDTVPDYMNIERDSEGFTERGWIDFGFRTYYALLDCGFRLRVSAGTASGVHPVQLGFGRVYVHLPDGFSYDGWIAGLDAGRSFVSTGPMLDVRFNGQGAGAQFTCTADDQPPVMITGTALSRRPLERIEIIINGRVHTIIEPTNRSTPAGGYETTLGVAVAPKGSHWIAVRCFEQHPQGRVRFAHTNPVFGDVDGQPLRPRQVEVEYFIDRMEQEIESNRDVLSAEALDEYRQALDAYREIAKTAR